MAYPTTLPAPGVTVAFRDGVRLAVTGTSLDVSDGDRPILLRLDGGDLSAALRRLAAGPVPLAELTGVLSTADRSALHRVLDRLARFVVRSVRVDGRDLVRIEHTAAGHEHRAVVVDPEVPVRLSRFALCRRRNGALVLESPLAKVRVLLVDPAARGVVAALGDQVTAADLAARAEAGGLGADRVAVLLGHLVGAGLAETAGQDGAFAADADPVLRQWDFHDLLFHSRIRAGRYDDPLGGLFPYVGSIDPLPAVKTPPDGPSVPLFRPDLDEVLAGDPRLTVALEGRRTFRQYAAEPITLRQLGEFLYRVARVRVRRPGGQGRDVELLSKPYPTGGAAYELELYLTVRRCAGLAPGIYYHDPVGHRLVLVNDDPDDRVALLRGAARATGDEADPDLLITMTARFQRVSWKYQGMAYATTLRHTGVLYQTMYLVATAMGLAPCGIGIGDADLSARAFGLDYLRESSVGDFLLGSRPPGNPPSWQEADGWHMLNDPAWAVWAGERLRAD
ncbi:SagB family peptide dehydrogenase [Dactylosporangium sp. NPDC051484]|uniref:SagB/ThcOx family dehydrogenase n=1 Tax=Dactylosporangium sp. NPDC051484 TaxID=3154942 RepID=UPI00344B1647